MDTQSKAFKALQKKWDKKLSDSGFDDIEDSTGRLKSWSSPSRHYNGYHNDTTLSAKIEYYRAVGHFLHEYQFKDSIEKFIWERHGEGLSVRDIVKILTKENLWWDKDRKNSAPNKRIVHLTVQRLARVMMRKIEEENSRD